MVKIVGTIDPSPLPPSSMLRYRAIDPVRRPNFVREGEGGGGGGGDWEEGGVMSSSYMIGSV